MTKSLKKDNIYLAEKLYEHADFLEALGDNPYKIRAYRRAAHVIHHLKNEVYELIENNFDLDQLPHIGKGISYAIHTFMESGDFKKNNAIISRKELNELEDVRGLGSKRIHILNKKYNVFTKKDLLKAIRAQKLNEFSTELIEQIKKEVQISKKKSTFLRLYHGLSIIKAILSKLELCKEAGEIICCGDYRRKQEVIEQLTLIIRCLEPEEVFNYLLTMPFIKSFLQKEKNHLKVQLTAGINMDIYCVNKKSIGASLIFHTGSDRHVFELTQYAQKKGFMLTEKGLFKEKQQVAGENETKIYERLGLSYIEPELREGRGEIDAAHSHQLPQLITVDDIKGDLHAHTNETDGQETLEAMVMAAFEKGYEYIAITDHSKSLTITNGLDEKRLLKQIKQIDKLNARLNNFLVLKSIEVDILEDGSLDLSDEVLKELDIVVCSVHSKFKLEETKQTERILRAMDNPYFNILGHATGRLIKSRPPYAINLERILQAAKERNCFIELNAQPYRLDVNDIYCKRAKEMGVKIAISSDAHTIRGFNFMQLGIYQARRGWLEKQDVINTRSWSDLRKLLRK